MRRLSATVLVATVIVTGGCGVELAVIGAAASAASAGSAVYKRGKLNAAWNAPFDLVLAAAEVAVSELSLTILASDGDVGEGTWELRCETNDGDEVVIRIYAETPSLTSFQIDVGWFGSEPVARLTLKRMALAIDLNTETSDFNTPAAVILVPESSGGQPPPDPIILVPEQD